MREIKFRAYDINHKEMWRDVYPTDKPNILLHKVNTVSKSYTGHGVHEESYTQTWDVLEGNWSQSKQPYIFMQYSGLKDKNGKEIYEGDIVKTKDSGTYHDIYSLYIVRNGIERIEDNEGYQDNLISGFYLELFFYTDYLGIKHKVSKQYSHIDFLEDCEIIGNIHENPELLEERK